MDPSNPQLNQHSAGWWVRNRPAALQMYVPTSAQWTLWGSVLPGNRVMIWVSFLLGAMIASAAAALGRKVEGRPQAQKLVSGLPTASSLLALLYSVSVGAPSGRGVTAGAVAALPTTRPKEVILVMILCYWLAENLLPYLGRRLLGLLLDALDRWGLTDRLADKMATRLGREDVTAPTGEQRPDGVRLVKKATVLP